MPQVTKDTRVLKDPVTGELISVPAAEADEKAAQQGLEYATLKEIDTFNERERYGSAGQTALGALELAGEAATLGAYQGDLARRRVLRREHPGIAFGAEAAGTLAPGLLSGGAVSALGGAGRAAAAASVVAEGGVSGFSQEQIQAREEGRDIDIGNVLLYGVGGEIAGRMIPKAIGGALRKAAGTGAEAVGGAADNVLLRAEQRATQSGSDLAEAAPGPERDRFLRDNARDLNNVSADRAAKAMDRASSEFSDLGDVSKKRNKIRNLVSKEHVGQDKWVAQQLDELQAFRDNLEGGAVSKRPSVAGRSLEDLKALPLDEADQLRVQALKEDPTFRETGRVSSNDGAQGITIVDDVGEQVLRDGRHRLAAAQELGRDDVWGRIVDGESGKVTYEGPIRLNNKGVGTNFADVQGLGGSVKKVSAALDDMEEALTKSRSAADRFIAADNAKRVLQRYHVALGRARGNALDRAYHDELMGMVDNLQEGFRRGLEDESVWGKAAQFQKDVNSAWSDKWFKGIQLTESDLARMTGKDFDAKSIIEYDPAKMRSFLEKDRIGRGLGQDGLERVLAGYEQMAAAHKKWGMADDKVLQKLQDDIAEVRKAVADADEVQAATPRANRADAAEEASDRLIGAVPVVGPAFVGMKRMLRNINTAGKQHIKSSANTLVNGVRRAANVADAIGERGAPVGAVAVGRLRERQNTDDRFKGTYPTMTQAFLAKREQIQTALQEPDTFVDAIAQSFGDLPEAFPDVHVRLVERMQASFKYLADNMPPGVENSLMAKHSTPPDVQSIRQFAKLWEAVMDPGAVVQDFQTMQATPEQARAIETVHPDIFAQLQSDALNAIVESPTLPTYERTRYLSQIFKLGPALGGAWRPSVAKNIKNSLNNAPPVGEGLPSPSIESMTGPTKPRGIASIAEGPTTTG